ncbi:MAG: hypothetical protein M1438_16170 [Deltaproteobacteria bacterium]|nr:hypothetical protein [Deltaproteobacteria bacterium]
MNRKIICLLGAMALLAGCAQDFPSTVTTPYEPYTYNSLVTKIPPGGNPNPTFDPLQVEKSALPDIKDLPSSPVVDQAGPARKYTGIIKNKTRYEVSVPSGNSGATLTIPARGWIEYTAYARHFPLTAYHNGKPFYCMNINASVGDYPFMCDRYDFMVEIVKPEPRPLAPGKKMKRYKRKAKVVEEG